MQIIIIVLFAFLVLVYVYSFIIIHRKRQQRNKSEVQEFHKKYHKKQYTQVNSLHTDAYAKYKKNISNNKNTIDYISKDEYF